MDATILSEVTALAENARNLEDAARQQAERAERLIKIIQKQATASGDVELKKADGRLTEAGAEAVNAAFDAGATVTEVSKKFGIHVSAASNRRMIWQAKRAVGLSPSATKAVRAMSSSKV